jgi:hypothetical protein
MTLHIPERCAGEIGARRDPDPPASRHLEVPRRQPGGGPRCARPTSALASQWRAQRRRSPREPSHPQTQPQAALEGAEGRSICRRSGTPRSHSRAGAGGRPPCRGQAGAVQGQEDEQPKCRVSWTSQRRPVAWRARIAGTCKAASAPVWTLHRAPLRRVPCRRLDVGDGYILAALPAPDVPARCSVISNAGYPSGASRPHRRCAPCPSVPRQACMPG